MPVIFYGLYLIASVTLFYDLLHATESFDNCHYLLVSITNVSKFSLNTYDHLP